MRQPRRVPWTSKSDLFALYDLIFSPSATTESRDAALSRMSIYISSPSCPAFMHLLHSLVGALQLPYPPRSPSESHSIRMVYAMAIVRFVNGMVDPLQTGLHARAISYLAASIGLPAGLVALRHRATHEDLPSLPVLRAALEQAMEYLHGQSLMPLLATGPPVVSRAEGLVAEWKKVVKARVRARDVSAESKSGIAVRKLLREFESVDVDEALDAIVRFGLVPVARRKRPNSRATEVPSEHRQIWLPLIAKLEETSADVPSRFAEALVSVILERSEVDSEEMRKEVASYRWNLGLWLVQTWRETSLPDEERVAIKRRLARELVHGDRILMRMYELLEGYGAKLEELGQLLPQPEEEEEVLQGLEVDGETEIDVDNALNAMEANLRALQDKLARRPTEDTQQSGDTEEIAGWKKADNWRPCPIGIWA